MAATGRTDEDLSYPMTPLQGVSHPAANETLKLSTLALNTALDKKPAALDTPPETPLGDDVESATRRGKGKETEFYSDADPIIPSRLTALPAELSTSILQYLAPTDLANIARTCRMMYTYAADERLWKAHVQDNVPCQQITSPYPFETFQELYAARDPHWFIPKYKLWFADNGLPGRLMAVQYDQRRGMIEGFQVVARNKNTSFHTWHPNANTIISGFNPDVKIYHDNPILRLPVAAGAKSSESGSQHQRPKAGTRFKPEFYMPTTDLSGLQSSFAFAKGLTPDEVSARLNPPFPYRNVWPPRSIPSPQRVVGAGLDHPSSLDSRRDRPNTRGQVCERAFRIHKWLHVTPIDNPHGLFPEPFETWQGIPHHGAAHALSNVTTGTSAANLFWNNISAIMTHRFDPISGQSPVAEDVSTYSTLDPEQYTPTETKPFRGIWVGDYGLHGPEFLWIHQPDDEDEFIPPTRSDGESDEDFAQRERDAARYRGRLEAIKLTGDANIPRGEHSFVVDELGESGLARIETHAPFEGVRVVRSECHIADHGFSNARRIAGELFCISHDKLAYHWIDLNHISYFYRVNVDKLIVPLSSNPAA